MSKSISDRSKTSWDIHYNVLKMLDVNAPFTEDEKKEMLNEEWVPIGVAKVSEYKLESLARSLSVSHSKELVEKISEIIHGYWIQWSKAERSDDNTKIRWSTKLWKPYTELLDFQKNVYREQASKIVEILRNEVTEKEVTQ